MYLHHRRRASALALLLAAGCAKAPPATTAAPRDSVITNTVHVVDTVKVRDGDLEQRVNRLEMQLLGKDAQIEDLQQGLEAAQLEVVRTMAKLRTVATRAEAASGMAEAELAVQSLRNLRGALGQPELVQSTQLLAQSTEVFNRQNFGGALYLAGQAKGLAVRGKARLGGGDVPRTGEVMFPAPVTLVTTSRGNLREGPGTRFGVVQTLESGTGLVGISYVDEWVRVRDQGGRNGWVFSDLVSRRSN
ncbi:MAG: SH3 domain-containing protein [Gemmatimonadales bacterium]